MAETDKRNRKKSPGSLPDNGTAESTRIGLIATFLMVLVSAVLTAMAFHPTAIPLFAWFGLAPLLMVIARKSAPLAALWSLAAGYVFFFIGANWISTVSYMGLFAMCIPLCLYFGLFALVTNLAVRRLRLPLMLAAPVVWVACEYLRSFLFTGFPWLFLAHTQYAVLPLIQISDVTGAYGVSFLIVLVNAFVAEAALRALDKQRYRKFNTRGLLPRLICVIAAVALVLGYGFVRLDAVRSEMREGPRLLIVQPNIEQSIKESRSTRAQLSVPIEIQTRRAFERVTEANELPDLIVWPETMVQPGPDYAPKTPDDYTENNKKLAELIGDMGRYFMTGGTHVREEPHEYLQWDKARQDLVKEAQPFTDWHNSAYVFGPDGEIKGRYDKIHLVPFGEFIPFKPQLPFMGNVILHSAGFVRHLEPGSRVVFFEMKDAQGKPYVFTTPICYEVGFPDLFTTFVAENGKKKADFVVNISNDGWFRESAELEQTTAIAAFRAVENRVGVVRSTNTGISAVIRPDGYFSWKDDVLRDANGNMKSVQGELTRNVYVCGSLTIYTRLKDWFAIAMLVLSGLAFTTSIILPRFTAAKK